jgi:hypothetical protein
MPLRAAGVDVAPRQQLLPQLEEMVRFFRVVSNILLAILLLAVATATEYSVHGVTERTHELGVMMALGTSPAPLREWFTRRSRSSCCLDCRLRRGHRAVAYLGRVGIDLSAF